MPKDTKEMHIGTRVTPTVHAQLNLIKDLRGMSSLADLLNDYILTGLTLDSTDIERKIEERLNAEKDRLLRQARGLAPIDSVEDEEEEDDPSMFEDDDEDSVAGPIPPIVPTVGASRDTSDLIPD